MGDLFKFTWPLSFKNKNFIFVCTWGQKTSPPEDWKTNFWVYAVTSKTYAKVNCCLWSSLKWEQRFFVVLASCFEWEKRERKKYYHFQSLNWLTLFCVGFAAASAALQGHPWQSVIKYLNRFWLVLKLFVALIMFPQSHMASKKDKWVIWYRIELF